MLVRRRRRGLRFPAAMDLDQPLKFMCALAALFYPTFSHCSSSAHSIHNYFAQFVQCTMSCLIPVAPMTIRIPRYLTWRKLR